MTSPSGPITPSDIKNKLGSIQGEAVEQVENAKNQLLAVATVVGVLALLAAFLLGRRGGKRSSPATAARRA